MPILHANLETDLRLAAALDQSLFVTLTDMASIESSGALDYLGSVNGTGSDTSRLRYASLGGADHMAATAAEDTDVVETGLTDASVDIAVVRHALVRNVGDLAVATGFASDIDPETLARDMALSRAGRFNDVFFTALATATTNVGTTTVDMSADDFHDAKYQLQLNSVPGPYFCALSPRQLSDFQESLRAEGGAAQFSPATMAMLDIKGQGPAGEYLGVSIWTFSDVVSGAADDEGGMWGAGAFGWKNAMVSPPAGAGSSLVVRMDDLIVEVSRDASRALSEVAGSAYFGIGLREQARVVGIVTDAP